MNLKTYNLALVRLGLMALVTVALCACSGTSLREEPIPMERMMPIASDSDGRISVTIESLIVRNGPGSWADNADWDEYQLKVQNLGDTAVSLNEVVIIDGMNQTSNSTTSRKQLVKRSREVLRRHSDAGLDVQAGAGSGILIGSGAAASMIGVGTVSAAGTGALVSGGTASLAGASAAASGFLLLGPALITTGIIRGINNSKVHDQIENRSTSIPLVVPPGSTATLRLFFSMVPSPQQLVLTYQDGQSNRVIVVNTRAALDGLHLIPKQEE